LDRSGKKLGLRGLSQIDKIRGQSEIMDHILCGLVLAQKIEKPTSKQEREKRLELEVRTAPKGDLVLMEGDYNKKRGKRGR